MTSLFLLNIDQEVVKIVPSKDILELWQDMGINEVDTINATLILSKELVADMEEVFYVGISDIEDEHAFNLYKLITKETTMTEIRLKGVQLAFDELEGKGYIRDLRPRNESFRSILSRVLQGTGWTLGYVDSNIPNVTTSLYYLNRLDSIAEIINVTGAELKFKVTITNNQITEKYVEAYTKIGQDTGKRFVYGTNSLEIVAEEDIGGIYTSAVGRGRGEEISSAEDNPSGQAGYGRKITFADVEWKKSNGHPVDKPLGQEWVEIPEATEMFGYPDGSARNALLEFPSVVDPEQLIWETYHELLDLSRPKVQFKTKVDNIGLSHYGDTVTIVRYDIDLKYQARIFKVRYNRLNLGASELDIGDVVLDSSAKKQARFRKEVSRDLEQVNRDIETTYSIASDGPRVFYGSGEPTSRKVNDVWFEKFNNGTTRIRVWNGNQWVIEVDTEDILNNTQGIESVNEQVVINRSELEVEIDSLQNQIRDIQSIISDRGSPFRVATFNIWHSRINVEAYKNFAISNRLDIIGLQEVLETTPEELKTYGLNNVKYEGSWYNYGNAIQSRFNLDGAEVFELPSASYGRQILMKTNIEFEGKAISVYNTHLTAEVDDTVRLQQLEFIKQTMDDDTTEYKILTGDFNIQEKAHYNLLGNLKSAQGHNGVWHDTWDVNIEPWGDGAIDNILVTPNIDILKVDMPLDKLGSDHYMLWAEIALR